MAEAGSESDDGSSAAVAETALLYMLLSTSVYNAVDSSPCPADAVPLPSDADVTPSNTSAAAFDCHIVSLNGWQFQTRVVPEEDRDVEVADVYAKGSKCLVVFRGTSNLEDITHYDLFMNLNETALGATGTAVMAGIAEYYKNLKDGVLQACEEAGASGEVVSTGHSLGGGASVAMATDDASSETWSFASPKMFFTGGSYTSAAGECPLTLPGYEFYTRFQTDGDSLRTDYNDVVPSFTSCMTTLGLLCTGATCSTNIRLTQECWDEDCASDDDGNVTYPVYSHDTMSATDPPSQLEHSMMTYTHTTALYLTTVRKWADAMSEQQRSRRRAWVVERVET